jgi:hypothetical protein
METYDGNILTKFIIVIIFDKYNKNYDFQSK